MRFINTFERHEGRSNLSLEEYYRQLRIELGDNVLTMKIVYLDTKFWLLLRDASLHPDRDSKTTNFLKLCVKLVSVKKCIFPISEDTFLEITKQVDLKTLKATARMVDKLSMGISIIGFEERVNTEVIHFIYHTLKKPVFDMSQLVWTKLAYNMEFYTFEHPSLSQSENLVMQKSFLDQMWSISMMEMIEVMLEGGKYTRAPDFNMADLWNAGKSRHHHEARSYQQMYLNEIAGIVDCFRENLAELSVAIFEQDTGKKVPNSEKEQHKAESMRLWGNVIYNLFRLKKVGNHLPSMNIVASLHAAVRWDKNRKYEDNDYHDFRHAVSALPYCDFFFTERSLAHLVTQKNLAFDQVYSCKVGSNITFAHEALFEVSIS